MVLLNVVCISSVIKHSEKQDQHVLHDLMNHQSMLVAYLFVVRWSETPSTTYSDADEFNQVSQLSSGDVLIRRRALLGVSELLQSPICYVQCVSNNAIKPLTTLLKVLNKYQFQIVNVQIH